MPTRIGVHGGGTSPSASTLVDVATLRSASAPHRLEYSREAARKSRAAFAHVGTTANGRSCDRSDACPEALSRCRAHRR
jgi:hypothetical protein